jgi:DNA-binding NarL/FixJ family response regulator
MNTPKRISVVLAEDHEIVRQGLRKLLEAEADMEVVGEASTGRQVIALTRKLRPNVVVMDIAMPQLNGLEATRQICESFPGTKVIILSAHSDDAYVEQVTAFGAAGYLIKQASANCLSEAIRTVHRGGTVYSPSVARRRNREDARSSIRSKRPGKEDNRLSSREVEVLQLIAEGQANKQVAAELGISVKTVEKHRQRLMQKLDIHDTAGLTRHAITVGIIENDVQMTIT